MTTSFLKDHPDVVQKLVNGQVAANDYIKTNPFDAQELRVEQHRQDHRQADPR